MNPYEDLCVISLSKGLLCGPGQGPKLIRVVG